jgi:hypothetical protein
MLIRKFYIKSEDSPRFLGDLLRLFRGEFYTAYKKIMEKFKGKEESKCVMEMVDRAREIVPSLYPLEARKVEFTHIPRHWIPAIRGLYNLHHRTRPILNYSSHSGNTTVSMWIDDDSDSHHRIWVIQLRDGSSIDLEKLSHWNLPQEDREWDEEE